MADELNAKRKPQIKKIIKVIVGIITTAAGIVAILTYLQFPPPPPPPSLSLPEQLDSFFGEKNWFCYPDDNPTAVGVKRIPRNFKVVSPVREVHTHQGIFKKGKVVPGDCGAHIILEKAWQEDDIPSWQVDAIYEWRVKRNANEIDITSHWLDEKFGKDNWKANLNFSFSAEIKELREELPVEFPFTSVDANNLKHGVGMKPVGSKFKATVWVGGKIKYGDEIEEVARSFIKAIYNKDIKGILNLADEVGILNGNVRIPKNKLLEYLKLETSELYENLYRQPSDINSISCKNVKNGKVLISPYSFYSTCGENFDIDIFKVNFQGESYRISFVSHDRYKADECQYRVWTGALKLKNVDESYFIDSWFLDE